MIRVPIHPKTFYFHILVNAQVCAIITPTRTQFRRTIQQLLLKREYTQENTDELHLIISIHKTHQKEANILVLRSRQNSGAKKYTSVNSCQSRSISVGMLRIWKLHPNYFRWLASFRQTELSSILLQLRIWRDGYSANIPSRVVLFAHRH